MTKFKEELLFKLRFSFIENVDTILHSELEIIYVLNKNIELHINSEKILLKTGNIYIINPGIPHSFHSDCNGLICRILIPWNRFNSETLHLPLFQSDLSINKNNQDQEIYFLLNQLLYFYLKQNKSTKDLNLICKNIISVLSREFIINTHDFFGDNDDSDQDMRIREALYYIHTNYDKPLSLTELSDHLHLSASYLSRYFKKNLGFNFKDYLTKIRLWHVADDLENTSGSVLHLAYANGFTNLNIFGKSFRELYGMSPTDYRTTITSKYETQLKNNSTFFKTLLSEIEKKYPTLNIQTSINTCSSKIDTQSTIPMTYPWKKAINIGALIDVLNTVVQKQLLQLKKEMNFMYIRIWGIYPEILSIHEKTFQLNFSRIDHTISFLLENDMRPMLQLGPKPRDKDDIPDSIGPFELNNIIPEYLDDTAYAAILDEFMHHMVVRFGPGEVAHWIFEMWCPCPWDAPWDTWYTDEKYKIFYNTIKKYAPEALAGYGEFVVPIHAQLIEQSSVYWKKNNILPDFISFQLYVDHDIAETVHTNTNGISMNNYFSHEIECIHQLLNKLDMPKIPLFISHWNMTASHTNNLNDTCLKGAWMMKNMIDIYRHTDMLAYSMLSDMFGQAKHILPMLSGESGLITKDGIYKPALYAILFLNRASEFMIVIREHFMLTRDRFGNFALLFHNIRSDAVMADDTSYDDDEKYTLNIHLVLENVTSGKYYVRKTSISPQYGSVLDEFSHWGFPNQLYPEDYKYLQKICIPHVNIMQCETSGNFLELKISASANEFGIIEILHQY